MTKRGAIKRIFFFFTFIIGIFKNIYSKERSRLILIWLAPNHFHCRVRLCQCVPYKKVITEKRWDGRGWRLDGFVDKWCKQWYLICRFEWKRVILIIQPTNSASAPTTTREKWVYFESGCIVSLIDTSTWRRRCYRYGSFFFSLAFKINMRWGFDDQKYIKIHKCYVSILSSGKRKIRTRSTFRVKVW